MRLLGREMNEKIFMGFRLTLRPECEALLCSGWPTLELCGAFVSIRREVARSRCCHLAPAPCYDRQKLPDSNHAAAARRANESNYYCRPEESEKVDPVDSIVCLPASNQQPLAFYLETACR